jgi:ComEC/Rec2-related protein
MLVQWTLAYLAGVVAYVVGVQDLYTATFVVISFLLIVFIKDINDIFYIKDILKFKNKMSFIIFTPLFFSVGLLHINHVTKPVSYLVYTQTPITFEGLVVNRENTVNQTLITVKPDTVTNTDTQATIDSSDIYLRIPVSMFQKYELYEKVRGTAITTSQQDWTVSEKQKFLYRYETDRFLVDQLVYVSPYNSHVENLGLNNSLHAKFWRTLDKIKMSFIKILQMYLTEPYSSLASGITLGETSTLSASTQQTFKDSGLIHLMVLSGSNVSFIIAIIWFLSRGVSIRKRVSSTLGLTWIFITLTGLSAPATRAGVMATLVILAEASGRPKSLVRALILALGILTAFDPRSLTSSPSLHLSFLACFGLFIVAPLLESILTKKFTPSWWLTALSLIVGIAICTDVYILALSGRVSLAGGLLTLVSEPLVAASTILTLSTIILNFISGFLASAVSYFNTLTLSTFLQIAEFGSHHLPIATFSLSRTFIIAYYSILIPVCSWLYYRQHNLHQKSSTELILLHE